MSTMAKTLTVNVEEDVEREFRERAGLRFGKHKGYLGKAITEAMREWSKKGNDDLEAQALALLKKGIKMKKWKFNREELHER